MDRVAVFVDAGYLFAQGSIELCGTKLARGRIDRDHDALAAKLKSFAEAASTLPLLKIYRYDGTSQGPTSQHITLAGMADIKVRLGFVNSQGQQKGVDSLIVTDMITLARNRAMAECILLSGDEDLRVGVQQAQEYGVRVHLLGLSPHVAAGRFFFYRKPMQLTSGRHRTSVASCGATLRQNPMRHLRERPSLLTVEGLQTSWKKLPGRLRTRCQQIRFPHSSRASGRRVSGQGRLTVRYWCNHGVH